MADAFCGEIRIFAGNFAPAGWAMCNGQLLPISEFEELFTLIGTTYGGDGESTFALPNLQSRVPLHTGNGFILGEIGGVESVTLTEAQIPSHNHPTNANGGGNVVSPSDAFWSSDPSGNTAAYVTSQTGFTGTMAADAILPTGGSQPHSNLQPFVALNYIISLFGIFPSQS